MTQTSPVALVTGGASGIGASVAKRWIGDGGQVAILDIDEERVAEAVRAMGEETAIGLVADVTDNAAVVAAINEVHDRFAGRLDALVNSAGVAEAVSAANSPDEEWVRLIDVHLNGTMRVCRAAHSHLKRNGGAIVNISSVVASNGLPGRSNYAAAKAGVEGLTRALAVEWSPQIRVNAVAPGYIQTPMLERRIKDGSLDMGPVVARTPIGRLGDPSELASAIVFLASKESSYITGTVLKADGGMSIEGNWYALETS